MENLMKLTITITQTEAGEWEVCFGAKGITDVVAFTNSTNFTLGLHMITKALATNGESEDGEA